MDTKLEIDMTRAYCKETRRNLKHISKENKMCGAENKPEDFSQYMEGK
jgi:hypothetical protein